MLVIRAPNKVEGAVTSPANPIAGSIKPLWNLRHNVVKEALASELGATQIAARQSTSPDVEFPRHERRDQPASGIQNLERRADEGAAIASGDAREPAHDRLGLGAQT
jgi:hypothetical protein